ncbi:MAG: response regulator [Candidatus Omnitrophota bacterium]
MTEKNKGKKVVIADDDYYIRRIFQMALTQKNFEVDTVKDGYELLDYLKKKCLTS